MLGELVLGGEAVIANGTVVDSICHYVKINAGYDVKQYFIGTEGTLGIVTKAVLRLWPRPTERAVAFCSLLTFPDRSEEHTSELQSRQYLVCRLLLEKKKEKSKPHVRSCVMLPSSSPVDVGTVTGTLVGVQ